MTDRPEPRIEIHPDGDALAAAVGGALHGRLSRMEEAGREPHLGLTGGSIAGRVHTEIARHHAADLPDVRPIDWSRVTMWWGDERFVPADSPERNAGQARHSFLDAVGATRVHEVPSSDQVADAEEAAQSYADLLRTHGGDEFDILMLGVGPDGHTASLFPHRPALDVDDRPAVAVHDAPKPPADRVSLTFAALNRARTVWFLVSGEDKAAAVARALAPEGSVADTPARGVRGSVETTWFLDAAAASHL